MSKNLDPKLNELLNEKRSAEASRTQIQLEILDNYALFRGWSVNGQDVLYKYFAEKYHWTPSQVRSLTYEEIDALLDGEEGF